MNTPSYNKMQAMCFKKKRMSYNLAIKIAKEWNQRYYQCPICQSYHTTKLTEEEYLEGLPEFPKEEPKKEPPKDQPKAKEPILDPKQRDKNIKLIRFLVRFAPLNILSKVADNLGIIPPLPKERPDWKDYIILDIENLKWKKIPEVTINKTADLLKDING
jgi:hypothetical protein